MKYKDLASKLKSHGWYLKREGGNHEIWTNGKIDRPVPRHKEINKHTANGILKVAKNNPRRQPN